MDPLYYIFRHVKNSFFEMANVHHLTSSLFTPTATPATLYPAFKSRQRRSAAAATTWRMHAINPLGVGFSIAKTIFESPRGSEVLWGGGPGVRMAAQKRVHNAVKFANSAIKNYVYVVVWGIFKSTFFKVFLSLRSSGRSVRNNFKKVSLRQPVRFL